MRLLVVTQAMDAEDPVLGFFARWVEEFAIRSERIEVVCLREGSHALKANVRVHSLGKERGAAGRAAYAWRFLSLVWRLRRGYDAVFVHMNQEYVLIAGWLWRLLGKRVYLWRNHYAGSWLTTAAAFFCDKIYCTSAYSYTAKYWKTEFMPVGVDTERFYPDAHSSRTPRSILFLARMAPSKRPGMLLDALAILAATGAEFTASFVGSPLPHDVQFYEHLQEKARALGLADQVTFYPSVSREQTVARYRSHEIFVNASPSGMLDKTLFEAAACGCTVLASSEDFAELAGADAHFASTEELAGRLKEVLQRKPAQDRSFVARESLAALGARLAQSMSFPRRPVRDLAWRALYFADKFARRRPRFTILLYHSISASDDPFAVAPYELDRQMRFMKRHADSVPLARAFAYAAGELIKRDTVAVTFDDGYRDFATEALPILKRHGIPATVFALGSEPDRAELGNEHPLLGAADAPALRAPLVTVGSHGLTHRKLTRLLPKALAIELADSRANMQERYSAMPEFIAYPKGSYNARVIRAAADAGYAGGVTAVERSVRMGDNSFALPRVQIAGDTSPALFAAKLTRAADWYYALWKFFRA